MNRTFLIILMIGTAMMIAVIGHHEPTAQLDTMPWQVDRLENGSLRVFGITLGKTSIQDANQIFANFGETRLRVNTDNNDFNTYQLIANYDDLIIGGLVAKISLTYQIEQSTLEELYHSLDPLRNNPEANHGIQLYPVDNETKINYLSTPISTITYIPSIDYGIETIRQSFGPATEEKQINEELQLLSYPEMGLQIYIHKNELDHFVYASLK